MMHLLHFIYGYVMLAIWLRTIQVIKEEISGRHFLLIV